MTRTFLAIGLVAGAVSAQAAIIIEMNPTTNLVASAERVFFIAPPGPVPLLNGMGESSLSTVRFGDTSGNYEFIVNDQHTITGGDGQLRDATFGMLDETAMLRTVQFQFNSESDGAVTLNVSAPGQPARQETFLLSGAGAHTFRVSTTDESVFSGVTLNYGNFTNDAISSMSQIYVDHVSSPVPEPASLAVLGVGAIALIRRRRKA